MSTVVETVYGPVRGVDDGAVTSWQGVRYAAPPTGDLRWRAPQPPEPWTEVADAGVFGPVCPQPVEPRIPIDLGAPQGDDCLTAAALSPAAARIERARVSACHSEINASVPGRPSVTREAASRNSDWMP